MLPVIQVGPLAIQVPGLILLAGIWLGLTLAERYASYRNITANTIYNIVFIGLVAGLIGSRLIYVIRYFEVFISNPASLFSLNPGLLDPFGGAVIALIVIAAYVNKKKLRPWLILDALTPFFAVVSIAISLSHIASGAAYGMESNLPWAINIWGADRHPAQIYETIVAIGVLTIMWPGRKLWLTQNPGVYFLSFSALTAGSRLFLEAYRADSSILLEGIRYAQVASWIVLAVCLWGIYRLKSSDKAPQEDSS